MVLIVFNILFDDNFKYFNLKKFSMHVVSKFYYQSIIQIKLGTLLMFERSVQLTIS